MFEEKSEMRTGSLEWGLGFVYETEYSNDSSSGSFHPSSVRVKVVESGSPPVMGWIVSDPPSEVDPPPVHVGEEAGYAIK